MLGVDAFWVSTNIPFDNGPLTVLHHLFFSSSNEDMCTSSSCGMSAPSPASPSWLITFPTLLRQSNRPHKQLPSRGTFGATNSQTCFRSTTTSAAAAPAPRLPKALSRFSSSRRLPERGTTSKAQRKPLHAPQPQLRQPPLGTPCFLHHSPARPTRRKQACFAVGSSSSTRNSMIGPIPKSCPRNRLQRGPSSRNCPHTSWTQS